MLSGVTPEAFAARLGALGPFEPRPHVAVAVSGGADSTALAVLADVWARGRGGRITALIVDHGLRAGSDDEAALTASRLARRGIVGHILVLRGISRGPRLAERARAARYAALEAACAASGVVHLLIGHHAGDQAETVLMRAARASGARGLAAMAAIRETAHVRLLRPLLDIPPAALRATLIAAGIDWVEDPSNHDPAALRTRLRAARADPQGTGPATRALVVAAERDGHARADAEAQAAAILGGRVAIHPEGFALLSPGPIRADALAALVAMIGGADRPPPIRQLVALAARPTAGTIGGVRILPAGRLLPGAWLLVREAVAMAAPVPAVAGATWDGRFRLRRTIAQTQIGALGADSVAFRKSSRLPDAVLQTLPALRRDGAPIVVPHLGAGAAGPASIFVAAPNLPAACAPFAPGIRQCYGWGCGVRGGTPCPGAQAEDVSIVRAAGNAAPLQRS